MTDFIPFNPATTLVELRYTDTLQQAAADGPYPILCWLYTADGTSYAAFLEVNYYWTSGKIVTSQVSLYVAGGVNTCNDISVLQGQQADLVTMNMTSAHVFTINSAAKADFTSCSYYQPWVDLVNSGTVTRIQIRLSCSPSTCAAVSTEYRLRNKRSKRYDILDH